MHLKVLAKYICWHLWAHSFRRVTESTALLKTNIGLHPYIASSFWLLHVDYTYCYSREIKLTITWPTKSKYLHDWPTFLSRESCSARTSTCPGFWWCQVSRMLPPLGWWWWLTSRDFRWRDQNSNKQVPVKARFLTTLDSSASWKLEIFICSHSVLHTN